MGSMPGDQTVPRAELAALAWSASWLGNKPGFQVEVHTDCQFVVDTWQRLQRGDTLSSLAHPDLAQHLVGVCNFTVLKVKAHNAAGARADALPALQWATAGNEAADATQRTQKPLIKRSISK